MTVSVPVILFTLAAIVVACVGGVSTGVASLDGLLRGDSEALQILESQVRKVKVRGSEEEIKEYRFKDPRELALKAMQEIQEERNKLYQPVNDIFEKQLKPRLEKLLTPKQKAAGEQAKNKPAGPNAQPGQPPTPPPGQPAGWPAGPRRPPARTIEAPLTRTRQRSDTPATVA